MGKIDELAAEAFFEGRNFKRGNTEVKVYLELDKVWFRELILHGNTIAIQTFDNWIYITNGGYRPIDRWGNCLPISVTTKNRLNALGARFGVKIHVSKREAYLNDTLWDAEHAVAISNIPARKTRGLQYKAHNHMVTNFE